MSYPEYISIHVDSESNYDKLMEWFEKNNVLWNDGKKATEHSIYKKYGSETCINFDTQRHILMFGPKKYYEEHHYKIVTFGEYCKINPKIMAGDSLIITQKLINILNKRT